jgi:hypothetical protein
MTVIIHYIESLMVVFDTNHDSVMSEQEVLGAMPRFRDFIVKMSPLGNWLVDDIFLFMIYKGEKPTALKMPGFLWERRKTGLGTVNRLNLIRVLGLLKSQAKAEAIKPELEQNNIGQAH